MQRNYNHVYSLLVTEKEDLVGHIAYSLYKQEKIEYIKKHTDDGTPLNDADLIPFNEISSTESAIESYRLKADVLLQGFIESVLEESINDIESQAVTQQSEILKDIVTPLKRKFWSDVWIGVLSAFIFAAILALIAFILQFQGSTINVNVDKPQAENTNK